MPHAALWVVQQATRSDLLLSIPSFNAARGFVGGATDATVARISFVRCFNAARGFVGGATIGRFNGLDMEFGFQCRTRLCGWCNSGTASFSKESPRFNAARGFVGGATASLAALVPLGGKSSFGKSPEI